MTGDPGFWLIDDGRRAFARAIGYRLTAATLVLELGRRAGLFGYLALALGGVALTLGHRCC